MIAATSPSPAGGFHITTPPAIVRCMKTFTVAMALRAIRATYRLRGTATAHQRVMLRYYIACQRNPHARAYLRHIWRLTASVPMLGPVIASWYYDSGTTGCGFHARYGIATLIGVPCGGEVRLCHEGACVTATRDDSGPYVQGRLFDLDPVVKAALGCPDLCQVTYSELRLVRGR
jgi:hypothetical protein